MAENKYDLLLVPTKDNSRVKHQPWYRERLQNKYSKTVNKKDWKPKLNSSSWTFIKDGLDDFRDGKPPELDSDIVMKSSKGLEPNLFGIDLECERKPKQKITKKLPKNDIIYEKQLPKQKRRRERVEDMENSLLDHPLALFPHLEESIPADLFEDIVNLLDPAMKLEDEEEHQPRPYTPDNSSIAEKAGRKSTLSDDVFHGVDVKSSSPERYSGYKELVDSFKKNPYRWLPEQVEVNKEERLKALKKRQESPTQETGINDVTKEFCDWVRSLGEGSNNIEESTIYSLFASGYETKPALSVPIHVVELTNVPPELRTGEMTSNKDNHKRNEETTKDDESTYVPSWSKKYHTAWYLDPKKWTSRSPNEKLQDPKENKEKQMSESKKKSKDLDKVLATLHGARAFKDFVDTKKTRRPEFLEAVAQHQEAIDAELAKKLAEEMKAKEKPQTAESKSRDASHRPILSPRPRKTSNVE
eukprot:gene7344-8164_t